nr:hypothetical protein [Tanacetum cinerariifolium]
MNMSQDRQTQNVGGNGGNQIGQYAGQVAQNQQGYNAWQNGRIQGAQNAVQNAGVRSGGNQNGLVVVPGIADHSGIGNVVAARAEGTGIGNQARCYNCRGLGHITRNCTARPRRRDVAYLQTQLLIAQKEEAGIQLQAEEFDFMAATGDLDEIEEEEQYTDLLEPILERQLVSQNDNHVTSVAPSMVQSGGTVETSSAPNEETRAHQETVYRNLVDQVAQENKFLDKEFDLEAKIKDLENILLKRDQMVQTMHMLNPKPDSFYHPNKKMALGYPNPSYLKKAQLKQQSLYNGNLLLEDHDPPSVYDLEETLELAQESREKMRFLKKEIKPANYAKINHLSGIQFLQEAAKFVRDFKSLAKEADESLDKQKSLELEIERLLKASVSHDIMSIVQNGFVVPSDLQTELDPQLRDLKGKSSDTPSASNTLDLLNQKLESKIVELEFQMVNYECEISHLKTTYKNLFDSISSNRAHAKLYDLIYENAQLRARVFENTSESMKNTSWTSVTPHVDKPKLSAVTPHSKKLHASMPSHYVPQPREFNVVKHRNVIAPRMFKINPSQTPRVDLVPNKQSSASIRTNLITISQRHVTLKENASSDMVTASFTGLEHTTRTRRPQPKGNTRNARVPSASKSSEVKKNVTVEEHRGTLLLSKNQKTMSFECNNIKLAIRNDKYESVCANCKQCLVTANHDACLPSFVNALNSRANNLCANVPLSANQKRHRTQVCKPKQVGSKERIACKPRLPRLSLQWSPSGRNFNLKGKLVASNETNCLNDDKACTSNPQEPMRKWFPNSTVFLGRLSKFVRGASTQVVTSI